MKHRADVKLLKTWVELARRMGILVPGGSNGRGYIEAARAIGLHPTGKADAKTLMAAWASKVTADIFMGSTQKHEPMPVSTSSKPEQRALSFPRSSPPASTNPASPEFLQTFAWRQMRMQVLKRYGRRCMCCGATPDTGAIINVDHIKPRKLFPKLALDFDNLQVLCGDCNHGKGNWDRTDWRPGDDYLPPEQQQHINAILAE